MLTRKKYTTYHLPPTTYLRFSAAYLRLFRSRAGFSILELVIFSAIFTFITLGFITVLIAVVNVNARQGAAQEVNEQSQFLLEQIKFYVERSSLIEMPQDSATTTLRLRMAADSEDWTLITLSGGRVYLQKGSSSAQEAITTDSVIVSNLSFTKRSNSPGKDSVNVSFTVEYNTQNIRQMFSRSLRTAIARVSAATFDSNVVPSSSATYHLGVSGNVWSSVNQIINFSGSNVGIGTNSPQRKLQVAGGDVYISDADGGIVLKPPSGSTCFKLTITTAGQIATSSLTCP